MSATTKINTLISQALRRQQRRNTEIETIIKASMQAFIREEICTIFPFWFLRMEVGSGFLSTEFPLSQTELEAFAHISIPNHSGVEYWLDRGILRTIEGQAEYELFAPAETIAGDRTAAYWFGAKFQKSLGCAPITLKGKVEPEIQIHQQQVFLQMAGSYIPGKPCIAFMESGRERDVIRFSPTPDKAYLIALSWVLAEPINYYLAAGDVATTNYTNKFMQEHEEIYSYIAMLKTAEYFDDLPNIEFYNKMLFGEMHRSVGRLGGKIGDLKRAHERKLRKHKGSTPIYKANPLISSGGVDPWGRRA